MWFLDYQFKAPLKRSSEGRADIIVISSSDDTEPDSPPTSRLKQEKRRKERKKNRKRKETRTGRRNEEKKINVTVGKELRQWTRSTCSQFFQIMSVLSSACLFLASFCETRNFDPNQKMQLTCSRMH